MTTLAEIREAIKEQLTGIDGLHPYANRPDTILPNAAIILVAGRDPEHTLADYRHDLLRIELLVRVAKGVALSQVQMDAYTEPAGDASVYAALVADRTLGGEVDTINVGQWGPYTDVNFDGVDYIACSLPVEVYYAV